MLAIEEQPSAPVPVARAKRKQGPRRNPNAPYLFRGPRLCGRTEALNQLDNLRRIAREPPDLSAIMPAAPSASSTDAGAPTGGGDGSDHVP